MTHQIVTERLLDRLAKAARHFVTMRARTDATRGDVLAAEKYLATVLAEAEAAIAGDSLEGLRGAVERSQASLADMKESMTKLKNTQRQIKK